MEKDTATLTVDVLELDLPEGWDLDWVPSEDDDIEDYYEAESWQFSGCGD